MKVVEESWGFVVDVPALGSNNDTSSGNLSTLGSIHCLRASFCIRLKVQGRKYRTSGSCVLGAYHLRVS